jgi:hypothetical protein
MSSIQLKRIKLSQILMKMPHIDKEPMPVQGMSTVQPQSLIRKLSFNKLQGRNNDQPQTTPATVSLPQGKNSLFLTPNTLKKLQVGQKVKIKNHN